MSYATDLAMRLKALGLYCNVMSFADGTADVLGGTAYTTVALDGGDDGPVTIGLYQGFSFRIFSDSGAYSLSSEGQLVTTELSPISESAALEILRIIEADSAARKRNATVK
jgi:hypothetical protein